MAIGWYTITSPWSSPRISIRSVSRLFCRSSSSDDVIAGATIPQGSRTLSEATRQRNMSANLSIHSDRVLGSEDLRIKRFGRVFFRFLRLVFRRIGEDRNPACLLVELQHREDLEAVAIFDLDAQNDQVRLHAFDLRIRVLLRFDENNVVVPCIEYGFEQPHDFRAAVDDHHFLRSCGDGVVSTSTAGGGGCRLGGHGRRLGGLHCCPSPRTPTFMQNSCRALGQESL